MDKAHKLIWQAKMQMKTNWINAKRLLEAGIKEFPNEKELYLVLANLYLKQDLHKKAIRNFQEALKLSPNENYILFKTGNCFLMLDEYRLAIDQYNKCSESFPELIYNKAFAYYKLGKITTSISLMKQISSSAINTEMPLIFMTELHFLNHEYSKAISFIEEAERRFGKQGNLSYLKALAYYHQQYWLKAFVALQEADKMKLDTPNFLLNYGIVANKIGKTELAIDQLLRYIRLHNNDPQGYAELINIYLEHNRIEEANFVAQQAKKNSLFSLALSLSYNKLAKMKNS
ncbi:MAG: tetratricopeptide repeat protein [Candidatus Cloacimonetes bacterium]|nr:tetratricopeptide repeat protein [Candidatus Cloacimonadota bacterium]